MGVLFLAYEAPHKKHGKSSLQDDCQIGAGKNAFALYSSRIRRS